MVEKTVNAYVTMYGYPDNNPAYSATIAHPVIHQTAGGTGTFEDPITFATDTLPFGTKIYVPYLQKYFVAEDTIGDGSTTPGTEHVDLWAGGTQSTNVNDLMAVEYANTRSSAPIIINAEAGHPVDTTPFDPGAVASNSSGSHTTSGSATPSVDLIGTSELNGTSKADILTGTSIAEQLFGGKGNDKLSGMAGDDRLDGGSGNDFLKGGAGQDTLKGGGGRDYFQFTSVSDSGKGPVADQILDFHHSQHDKIDFSGIDANSLTASNDSFSFIGSSEFHGIAGELKYTGGVLSGDVNGDSVSDFDVQLANVSKFYSGDFIL
jgi:Ca2+-binding RTX toxin-like protein